MELVEQNNFTVCLTEFASLESKFSLKEKKPTTGKNRLCIMGVDYSIIQVF